MIGVNNDRIRAVVVNITNRIADENRVHMKTVLNAISRAFLICI